MINLKDKAVLFGKYDRYFAFNAIFLSYNL